MAKTPPPPPASNRSIPVAPPSSRPNLGSASSSLPPRSDVRRSSDPNLGLGSIPRSRGDSVDRVRLSTGGGGAASVPPRKRSDPNQVSPEAKELGERWMLAGVEHARAGRWSRAAPDLVQALEYLPDNEELRLYALWSTIQARDNEPVKRGERADLARLALATTKKEPDFAFGYYIAGDLSLLDGDVEQAHKLLTRAIKLDPGLLDAGRLLRVVEHRRAEQAPASKGGLFRRKLW